MAADGHTLACPAEQSSVLECPTRLFPYLRRRQRLQESWGLSRRRLAIGRERGAVSAVDEPGISLVEVIAFAVDDMEPIHLRIPPKLQYRNTQLCYREKDRPIS